MKFRLEKLRIFQQEDIFFRSRGELSLISEAFHLSGHLISWQKSPFAQKRTVASIFAQNLVGELLLINLESSSCSCFCITFAEISHMSVSGRVFQQTELTTWISLLK